MTELMQVLERKLRAVDSARRVILTTVTTPEMRKTGNPYLGRVQRYAQRLCTIGASYEDRVNDTREAQGMPRDFVAGPLPWGQRVEGTPLITHKGRVYVQVIVEKLLTIEDSIDGTLDLDGALKPFLPERDKNEVCPVRTIPLDTIRDLSFLNDAGEVIEFLNALVA